MDCIACGKASSFHCSACQTPYCSVACQKQDWAIHQTECTIDGKFDNPEYKNALAVSKHVRIIWDSKVDKNKKRRETNKQKKRIYLRLNPSSDAKYVVKLLSKIETQRHAQGESFWETKTRQKRDVSPTRPRESRLWKTVQPGYSSEEELPKPIPSPTLILPPSRPESGEMTMSEEQVNQKAKIALGTLEKAYQKSKKNPKALYETFDSVLRKYLSEPAILSHNESKNVFFHLLVLLADRKEQTRIKFEELEFKDRDQGLTKLTDETKAKQSEVKVLEKIFQQIHFWIFDQIFKDISVIFGDSNEILDKIKENSYNVNTATDLNFRGSYADLQYHLHGTQSIWMDPFMEQFRLMEEYGSIIFAWVKQRLAVGEEWNEEIAEEVGNALLQEPPLRDFDVYFPPK